MNFVFMCMIKIIGGQVLTKTPLDFENSKIKYIYIVGYAYLYSGQCARQLWDLVKGG